MRYVQINIVPHGSTGNVMMREHASRLAAGDESWVMWGRGRSARDEHEFNFGSQLGFYADVARTRLDGRAGFHSKRATRRLLRKLDEINPDVVHLHNIHGYYLDVDMLFSWLAKHNQRTVWTLHDCWAFTGHCSYFTYVGCDAWKDGCDHAGSCPQLREYPKTYATGAFRRNYRDKRDLFTRLPADKLMLVAPSEWLGGLVRQSFLRKYPVEVRRNEADRDVFKSTPSDFRKRHGLQGKFVVLGVASQWTRRKGLDDLLRLAGDLDDQFAVVVVGLEAKQIRNLPTVAPGMAQLLGLPPMANTHQLAETYTAADVLFNPTREDNYPTVNLEAQACGTFVVTYRTGGSAETIQPGCGIAVDGYPEALAYLQGHTLLTC